MSNNYNTFLATLQNNFAEMSKYPLFITDAGDLWETYINSIHPSMRQQYTCHACKKFVENFGGLVSISPDGIIHSIWFDTIVPDFEQVFLSMSRKIVNSEIKGMFVSANRTLGIPVTGEWHHISLQLPKSINLWNSTSLSAEQRLAESYQEYTMLSNYVKKYDINIVSTALGLLKSSALYRSEKVLGVCEWFYSLLEKLGKEKNKHSKIGILWYYVATAAKGNCHISSTMIGTLLDDIKDGLPFPEVSARFATKISPENYQRATVAQSQGEIEQAEKIFESMKAGNSLQRRFATIAEIPSFLWKPKTATKKYVTTPQGVFAAVPTKTTPSKDSPLIDGLPVQVITWEKFCKTVLGTATEIEVLVPSGTQKYMAIVTEEIPGSTPILQWDKEEFRNPYSWYYPVGIDSTMRERVVAAGGQYENNHIRATLIWHNRHDLDLHMIQPNGVEIDFTYKRDYSTGGYLDVDMNVRGETNTPVENIRHAIGGSKPLNGIYRVSVCFYAPHCSEEYTNYDVEVAVGTSIIKISGTFNGTRRGVVHQLYEFEYYNGTIVKSRVIRGNVTNTIKPNSWGVTENTFVKCQGITSSPNMWGEHPLQQFGEHVFFLLKDCKDTSGKGLGIIAETLRGEFWQARHVVDSFMKLQKILHPDVEQAAGIGMSKGRPWDLTLKVHSNGIYSFYKIDRWD